MPVSGSGSSRAHRMVLFRRLGRPELGLAFGEASQVLTAGRSPPRSGCWPAAAPASTAPRRMPVCAVQIQKDLLGQTRLLFHQPSLQCHSLRIVEARMAQEDTRHDTITRCASNPCQYPGCRVLGPDGLSAAQQSQHVATISRGSRRPPAWKQDTPARNRAGASGTTWGASPGATPSARSTLLLRSHFPPIESMVHPVPSGGNSPSIGVPHRKNPTSGRTNATTMFPLRDGAYSSGS